MRRWSSIWKNGSSFAGGRSTPDGLDVERMAQFIRTARRVRQFPLPEGTPPEQLLEHLNLLNEG